MKMSFKSFILALGFGSFSLMTSFIPVTAVSFNQDISQDLTQELAGDLLQQGRSLYEGGRYRQALNIWQQAIQFYASQGDIMNQALALNYLSLTYQELGELSPAKIAIEQSLELINTHEQIPAIFGQVLNTQGSLQLAMGESQKALATWEKSEQAYAQVSDEMGVIGAKINQAQALKTLGFYRRSQGILTEIQTQLQEQPDSLIKAISLRSLGHTLATVGNLEEAINVLQESLKITKNSNLPLETSATLLTLGNVNRDLQAYFMALNYYEEAIELSPSNFLKLEVQINQLALLAEMKNWQTMEKLIPIIQTNLESLPTNRDVIFAQVNLAQILLKADDKLTISTPQNILTILTKAIQQSREIKDLQGESYALGTLGTLYEQNQQLAEAQTLTQEALKIAQDLHAPHISYQWQWQLGRILEKQGQNSQAIASYDQAVTILQSLRQDLVAINPNVQFSFRDSVEPVYRELVSLLLESSADSTPSNQLKGETKTVTKIDQNNLIKARDVMESLRVAELENFFRQACLYLNTQNIDQVDRKAAVIYPIILPNKLAVIVALPGQKFSYYVTELPQSEIENELDLFLQSLNPAFSDRIRLNQSAKIYNWLIKPAEKQLENQKIETLVFVLDGVLRNIPMSALYDGKQYLIEKYQIAFTPGLQFIASNNNSNNNRISAIMGGLSESRQGFAALPGVETEISQISANVNAQKLLNENFTKEQLQQQIKQNSAPILHLATHGQFSSYPAKTFIITWDNKIDIDDFKQMIQSREINQLNPIELLVLSACETATGDKNAALGLAGMAVQSGARSTIATLWSVKDQSTALLMTKFYENLSESSKPVTKAEALQQAQIALIKSNEFKHPFYWAPFILVGNWR